MALHNHPSSWPADKVLAAARDRGKLIGACADTGHWYRTGKAPLENLKLLEGRIMSLHLKDLDEAKQDVPFGTGKCDVNAILAELRRQGFQGYFSIEYERGGVGDLMVNIAKCVEFFDQACAGLAK
jgi:sugar phosphate isomerase/epimerase